MPVESGYVIQTKGKLAVVKTVRSDACEGCSSKGYCDVMGGKEIHVEAVNGIGAVAGDHVMVELSDKTFISLSVLVYMVPVLALIGGMFVGKAIAARRGWDADMAALAVGLVFFATVMAVVRWIGLRKAAKDPSMTPKIIRVVKTGGSTHQ